MNGDGLHVGKYNQISAELELVLVGQGILVKLFVEPCSIFISSSCVVK